MDFSKQIRSPGTLTRPPPVDLPGVDDNGSVPGSEFRIQDNILPPSPGKAHDVANPMTVQAPGIMAGTSLAARLCWRTRPL